MGSVGPTRLRSSFSFTVSMLVPLVVHRELVAYLSVLPMMASVPRDVNWGPVAPKRRADAPAGGCTVDYSRCCDGIAPVNHCQRACKGCSPPGCLIISHLTACIAARSIHHYTDLNWFPVR